jgi:hypothetical protein
VLEGNERQIHLGEGAEKYCGLKGSQAVPACPSVKVRLNQSKALGIEKVKS